MSVLIGLRSGAGVEKSESRKKGTVFGRKLAKLDEMTAILLTIVDDQGPTAYQRLDENVIAGL